MRKATAMMILSLMLPAVVAAQDLASLEQQRKAAEHGNSDDQVDMGILYEFGFNMPKNSVTALAWYLRAADQGNELAIKRRDLLKTQMTPEEIEAAQRLAMELAGKKTDTAAPANAEPPPMPEAAPPAPATEANPPSEKPSTSP